MTTKMPRPACRAQGASGPIVSVTGGKVQGKSISAGGAMFKGIPFAAPPVGDLRWKAPQPVKPWSGVKQTTHFGDACACAAAIEDCQGRLLSFDRKLTGVAGVARAEEVS